MTTPERGPRDPTKDGLVCNSCLQWQWLRPAISRRLPTQCLKFGKTYVTTTMKPSSENSSFVLIEGPCCGDARFISEWLSRALKADEILQKMRLTDRDLFERIESLELIYSVAFAPVALACVRKWFRTLGAFTVNIPNSHWSDMLAVIADIGFLTQTGNRYQMTLPETLDRESIGSALLRLASTEDSEGCIHPEMLLLTITQPEAATWKKRLNKMPWAQRVADREILLGTELK